MAFVNEKIPEADRNKLEMEKCREVRSYFPEPDRWVADRERDVYLYPLGGGGPELPTFFCMNVQDKIVVFNVQELAPGSIGDYKTGMVILHRVSDLRIPQSLENQREKIKQLIREGLDAYGVFGNRTHVIAVNVEFI